MTFLRHLEKSVRRKAYPRAVRYIKRSWESEGVCYELPSVPKAEARGIRVWSRWKILGFFVLKRSLWTLFLESFPRAKTTYKFLWNSKNVTNITNYRMPAKSWYKGKRKSYTYLYFFCYIRNNKLRFKRSSNRLFLGLKNLQKQVHTFANKSIYFYICLEFLMCTIPHFI